VGRLIVRNINELPLRPVTQLTYEGKKKPVKNVKMRWIIHEMVGDENYRKQVALRFFELKPGAKIPFHNHFYQEIVIIMSGKVKVATKGKVCLVRKGGKTEVLSKNSVVLGSGDVFYTYPWEPHSLVNEGKETVTLYCIIDCPNCRVCTLPNEFL